MIRIIFRFNLALCIICLALVAGVSFASAWTGPTGSPPTNNVSMPINVGSSAQYKSGTFGAAGFFSDYGTYLALLGGNVGIGTALPQTTLSVLGTISLLRQPGTSVTPGPGPSIFLQSPSNNTSTVTDNDEFCTAGLCTTDNTPAASLENPYTCPAGSGGSVYSKDVYKKTATEYWRRSVTCVAGTENFSLRTDAGVLNFLNNSNAVKMSLSQEGDMWVSNKITASQFCIGDDCILAWPSGGTGGTTYTAGSGISITGATISVKSTGCTTGQVLQWNGTAWVCASMSGSGGITTETDPTVKDWAKADSDSRYLNTTGLTQIKSGVLQVNGFKNIGDTTLDGNVGIGIATQEAYKLNVAGIINVADVDGDIFRTYGATDPNKRWALANSATGLFQIIQRGDSWADQGTRLTIDRSGNVGIGTTNPGAYKLNVKGGNVNLEAGLDVGGIISSKGDIEVGNKISLSQLASSITVRPQGVGLSTYTDPVVFSGTPSSDPHDSDTQIMTSCSGLVAYTSSKKDYGKLGGSSYYERDVLCQVEGGNYVIKNEANTLKFINGGGDTKIRFGQDGALCFGATGSDCKSTWSGLGTTYTPGAGISIASNAISVNTSDNIFNVWDKDKNDDITSLTGTTPISITGAGNSRAIAISSCGSTGQVLQWNGTAWICASVASGGIIAETDPTVSAWAKASDDTKYLNNTTTSQIKSGALGVNGIFRSYSNAIFDGNVGIGIATQEAYKLNVAGIINVADVDGDIFRTYGATDPNKRWALANSATGLFQIIQRGDSWADQGTRLTIDRSGNVGIGTADPGAKLEVLGNVKIASQTSGDLSNSLEFGSGKTDSYGTWEFFSASAPVSSGDTCNNKVGVNLDNPEIYTCGEENRVCLDIAYGTQTLPGGTSQSGWFKRSITCVNPDEPLYRLQNDSGIFNFINNSNQTKFSLDQEGNANIGGGLGVTGQVKITGGAPGANKVLTSDNDGLASWTTIPPGVWTASGNNIYNNNTGNVGIGTTTPGDYKLYVDGKAFSRGWYTSSDLSLKTGIVPLASSLNKILAFQGVSFERKNNPGKKEIGFIAQDVEKILPELVSTGADGLKALSYDRITAVLVEAIKELKTENNSLKARIEKLEK